MDNLAIPSHRLASLAVPQFKLINPRDVFCPEVKILKATFPLSSEGKELCASMQSLLVGINSAQSHCFRAQGKCILFTGLFLQLEFV